jgi:uroporphyrin-3 C-methyltransferase
VKNDLAEIDRLAAAPLAPPLPELGSALRELRNLRATRALAQPRPAAPTGDGAGT